jgi:hypothetical protein
MKNRGSKKGERRGGRKVGTPNKMTVAAREAFQQAFDGLGSVDALIVWAKDNQSEFYKLYGRLIPVDVNAGLKVTHFEPLVIKGIEK